MVNQPGVCFPGVICELTRDWSTDSLIAANKSAGNTGMLLLRRRTSGLVLQVEIITGADVKGREDVPGLPLHITGDVLSASPNHTNLHSAVHCDCGVGKPDLRMSSISSCGGPCCETCMLLDLGCTFLLGVYSDWVVHFPMLWPSVFCLRQNCGF